jgi:hypothetical protein
MRVYVFYERKTGKIVHEHRQADEAVVRSNPDLLKLVHPSIKKSSLEVLQVDEQKIKPGRSYRINPKTRALEATKRDAPRGLCSIQQIGSLPKP